MNADFLESLSFNFGPEIMEAFADASVLEIMLNDDGKVWIERFGRPMEQHCTLSSSLALNVFQLLATANHVTVGEHRPSLQAVLPAERFGGARFQGFLPPVAGSPTFCIRKRPTRVFTMTDYVSRGILPEAGASALREAIRTRKNIVVVGGTGSGKTTFVNALQHELSLICPHERQLVLEDTREIQSDNPNTVYLTATDAVTLADLIVGALRYRPDRIHIGEVRDGAALNLLKAWNTGHPGGIGTYHADSAEEALPRMEELVEEATPAPKQALIGRALDVIVYLRKTPEGRKVTDILGVEKWDGNAREYITFNLLNAQEQP